MKKFLCLFPLLFVFSIVFAGSEVYKWVDEDGNVHFSDQPPENQQITEVEIQTPPAAGEVSEVENTAEDWLEQQRSVREAEKQEKKEQRYKAAAGRRDVCRNAKQILSILEIQCPVFYDGQGVLRALCPNQSVMVYKGEIRYIEDDARPAMIEHYRSQLKECGDADR